jgi:hypothetical protein
MATAYCLKCKCEREVKDSRYETLKNGALSVKGVCPTCGTKLSRILGTQEGR